ncbi:MAG: hypothetical protein IJU76_05690 [Desulfovibrionaceae bacterium]|nr:hypothetical protein [Desulfovibrionaceae bacterium]
MSYFTKRDEETTLPCPHCKKPLHIARTCHEVFMHCPECQKRYTLQTFISQADSVMEEFMNNVYCDRV